MILKQLHTPDLYIPQIKTYTANLNEQSMVNIKQLMHKISVKFAFCQQCWQWLYTWITLL